MDTLNNQLPQEQAPVETLIEKDEPKSSPSKILWAILGVLFLTVLISAVLIGDQKKDNEPVGTFSDGVTAEQAAPGESFGENEASQMEAELEATAIDGLSDAF